MEDMAGCNQALEEVFKAYLFAFREVSSGHFSEIQLVLATSWVAACASCIEMLFLLRALDDVRCPRAGAGK